MSNQRKRLGLIVISIILASFSTGWIIRGFSEGGNPVIDGLLGAFLPWFNASVGVKSPEYYRGTQNYTAWIESQSGGITDHGDLTGLGDDDHNLYLLQSGVEGLTGDWDVGNYDLTAKDITADEFYRTGLGNYTAWVESQSGGGVTDHGALTGLDDDDHSLYFLEDGSETLGSGLNAPGVDVNWIDLGGSNRTTWPSGGVTDHGALSGLNDDDHPSYVDKDGTEGLTGDWDVGNYVITTDGLASPWLDLGGDNRTSWPSGSGESSPGAYDIIIQVDSGTYTATHWNGTELWSSSDAESVFYNSNEFFGGNPGHIKFGTGTFDFDDTLHPSSFIAVSGMGKSQTKLRPDDSSVVPLIALDEKQGTATRQESVTLQDFMIDLRTFVGSTGIEIYNQKLMLIRDVDIRYFRLYGMYFDCDNSQFNMALIIEDVFFEAGAGGATAAMHLDDGVGTLDSWFNDIWGNIPDTTYGWYQEAGGDLVINDMHWDFATTSYCLHPNGGGEGGVVYNTHFNRPVSDNPQGNAWWLDLNSGSSQDNTIAYPHFINSANTFDLFEIDAGGGSNYRFQIYGGTIAGSEAHEYIMDCDDQSGLVDWTISHMKIPAGGTGSYNGIPTHFITDDVADQSSSYQVDTGTWSEPTWVGTPPNGQTCAMYNGDTSPYHRLWVYSSDAWHYYDSTG